MAFEVILHAAPGRLLIGGIKEHHSRFDTREEADGFVAAGIDVHRGCVPKHEITFEIKETAGPAPARSSEQIDLDRWVQRLRPTFDYSPWKPPFHYDAAGQIIMDSDNNSVFDVRGWGFMTGQGVKALGMSEEKAAKIQDAMARHVVELMNADAD